MVVFVRDRELLDLRGDMDVERQQGEEILLRGRDQHNYMWFFSYK
jgi:hypothetical protein